MKSMDCMDVYKDAEFYDLEFADREHEIPFFLKQAKEVGGPVLEVGCGTGRITLPIARAGIEIAGLDISRPMLRRARQKAKAARLAISLLEQDCRQIKAGRKYALIFSATNAMQHLLDLDSVNAFLTSAKRALRPGGTLILDVFNPNPAKLARTAATRYLHKTIRDAAGGEIRVEATTQYNAAEQILRLTLYYLRKGKLTRTKKVNLRCFYPEELSAICHFNGLKVVQRFGNYDETPFVSDSPKQILVCSTSGRS